MDWIKVKVRHAEYDFAGAPDNVFRAWIMMMMFVAATECKPLRKGLCKRLGEINYIELEKWLSENDTSIDVIIDKVLEDVEHINNRKAHDRKYMQKYRCKDLRKPLHKPLRKVLCNGKEKIREEKAGGNYNTIIINKEKYPFLKDSFFTNAFDSYLKNRRKKATEHAKELLLKDLHKHSLATAIAMLEQSIKHGWTGIFPLKTEIPTNRRMPS